MNAGVVFGALWANDLTRLGRPQTARGAYELVDAGAQRLVSPLARATGADEVLVRERLARGRRAFAAWSWREEEVVSWLWVSTGEEYAPPLRRMLRFPDRDCHGWGAGTREDHRCWGLFTGLLQYAGWRMRREGCHTMWDGVLEGNLPSQRAHARAGMRPVLRLVALHQPPPTRLLTWPVEQADARLVERARQLLEEGATWTHA